jgi:hypothetical protein
MLITPGAAVLDIIRNMTDKLPQPVVFLYDDLHVNSGRVRQEAVPPGLIFLPGVNIGIEPERHRFDALCPERVDAGERTRCAARMQQDFFHGNTPKTWIFYI